MTTIAVRKYEDRVEIASDTQVTAGGEKSYGVQKVFTTGEVTLGVTGHLRTLDLLKHQYRAPKFRKKDTVDSYVHGRVIPSLESLLVVNGMMIRSDDDPTSLSGVFELILVVRGSVFSLGADLSASPVEGFTAAGSGSAYAMGAMAMGATVEDAVEVASEFDVYTGVGA